VTAQHRKQKAEVMELDASMAVNLEELEHGE
jgi:hypothetical protein